MLQQDVSDTIIATLFVLRDEYFCPKSIDVAFVHGRAYGDDQEVLELAATLCNSKRVKNILLANSDGRKFGGSIPGEAAPSAQKRIKILVNQLKVDRRKIHLSDAAYHTKQESLAFLDSAIIHNWQNAVVITQPHQILRAMLGTVKAMAEKNKHINIYALTPNNVSWEAKVYGSQGEKVLSRFEHITEEYKRIPQYQKKGYISSYSDFYKYLSRRNRNMLRS